ncbi:MAG: hypothetical protein HY002_18565 [Candidatus Rokubacteria bacterium]|nr:hypothetical protein [Candidatus Rokubacteria bacterium]
MRLFRMLILYAARIARLHDLCIVVSPHHVKLYQTSLHFQQVGPPRPYQRVNGRLAVGLRLDLGLVRALTRVLRAGLSPGERYDFFAEPASCREVLARLRRDLARSALTPVQVAHFFAGNGSESAILAAGLLSAVRPAHDQGGPARSRRNHLPPWVERVPVGASAEGTDGAPALARGVLHGEPFHDGHA